MIRVYDIEKVEFTEREMKLIVAYCRVSSETQSLERQIAEVKKYGYDELVVEKKSGKNIEERPELLKVLEKLHKGDVLVIEALDRLSRDYKQINKVINKLKDNDVQLVVTSLPLTMQVKENDLMSQFVNDLIIQVITMIGQREREESKRRQRQGIDLALQRGGVFNGKPPEYSSNARNPQKRAIYNLVVNQLNEGIPIAKIAKQNGITRQTVYAIKKRAEEEINK